MIRRTLFLMFGLFLGVVAKNYLTGWYSIIFESIMLTGLIAVTIEIFRNRKKTV